MSETDTGIQAGRGKVRAVLLVAAAVLSSGCSRPAAAPARQIDGERALATARRIFALGPRVSGTEGASRAANWIRDRCREYTRHVTVDTWSESTPAGKTTFRNVRATLPGKDAGFIIVGTHYDTKYLPEVPGFAGANDSASSTAVTLEMMRVLSSRSNLPECRVEFLFFDGEECRERYGPHDGLHGSRRYARTLARRGALQDCRAMVLLDMVGDRDLTITIPPDNDPELCRRVFRIAERFGVREKFGYFLGGTILDDHVPFQERGIPCVNLIDFQYGPENRYWHTAEDTLDKLSAQSLEIVAEVALGLVDELAAR